MGRYLLDSNVFFRAKYEPQALRQETLQIIEDAENRLFVSVAALWELAIKAAKGKLPLYAKLVANGSDTVRQSLQDSSFELLSIELEHALAATALPQIHGDPFDRMMIAQAMMEGLTLITSDTVFQHYRGLKLLAA